MKGLVFHLLPFLATFVTALGLKAQVWCPAGARWTYNNFGLTESAPGYSTVTYNGDTMLFGQPCKRLVVDQYWIAGGSLQHITPFIYHVYEENDVLYFVSASGLPWDTLYWMGASVGDQWHLAGWPDDDACNQVTVTATGTIVVNGLTLPYVDYDLDSLGVMVQRRIVQRIGDLYDFWPWPMCDFGASEIRGLRCYQDDTFGFYSTGISPTCDYTNGIPNAPQTGVNAIFPNPGHDRFTLILGPGPSTITLFDATGRVALEERVSDERATIGTAHLHSGIYVVRVDEGAMSLRWLKE